MNSSINHEQNNVWTGIGETITELLVGTNWKKTGTRKEHTAAIEFFHLFNCFLNREVGKERGREREANIGDTWETMGWRDELIIINIGHSPPTPHSFPSNDWVPPY